MSRSACCRSTRTTARDMIRSLRGAALLDRFRGRPARDIDAVVQRHDRAVATVPRSPAVAVRSRDQSADRACQRRRRTRRRRPPRAAEAIGADGMDARPPPDGLNFELPEEIRMLKDTVRKFVDRELIPIERNRARKQQAQARGARASHRQGQGARACRLRRAARIRRARHGADRQGDGVGGARPHASRCPRAGSTFSVPTSARSSIISTMSRRRNTCCRPSVASSTGALPRPSPMLAAIPAACARPRCAMAITTSSTASSASSPAPTKRITLS